MLRPCAGCEFNVMIREGSDLDKFDHPGHAPGCMSMVHTPMAPNSRNDRNMFVRAHRGNGRLAYFRNPHTRKKSP